MVFSGRGIGARILLPRVMFAALLHPAHFRSLFPFPIPPRASLLLCSFRRGMTRTVTVEIACRAPGILSETVRIITAGETLALPVSARIIAPAVPASDSKEDADVAAAEAAMLARPAVGVREVFGLSTPAAAAGGAASTGGRA